MPFRLDEQDFITFMMFFKISQGHVQKIRRLPSRQFIPERNHLETATVRDEFQHFKNNCGQGRFERRGSAIVARRG